MFKAYKRPANEKKAGPPSRANPDKLIIDLINSLADKHGIATTRFGHPTAHGIGVQHLATRKQWEDIEGTLRYTGLVVGNHTYSIQIKSNTEPVYYHEYFVYLPGEAPDENTR